MTSPQDDRLHLEMVFSDLMNSKTLTRLNLAGFFLPVVFPRAYVTPSKMKLTLAVVLYKLI